MTEICNEPTKNGPCTMLKGHAASFHRHREYNGVTWSIHDKGSRRILETGSGVNKLNYAISRLRIPGARLIIEVNCS